VERRIVYKIHREEGVPVYHTCMNSLSNSELGKILVDTGGSVVERLEFFAPNADAIQHLVMQMVSKDNLNRLSAPIGVPKESAPVEVATNPEPQSLTSILEAKKQELADTKKAYTSIQEEFERIRRKKGQVGYEVDALDLAIQNELTHLSFEKAIELYEKIHDKVKRDSRRGITVQSTIASEYAKFVNDLKAFTN
jgi:hypothetical protein